MMKRLSLALLPVVAVVAAGCGANVTHLATSAAAKPVCPKAWLPGWQALANRINAAVYCPAWMPSPLTGQVKGNVSYAGSGGYVLSVSKDRSYLASFAWQEMPTGEVHVNLRGYPGETKIPTCISEDYKAGKLIRTPVPCFSDPHGTVNERGITGDVFTANQDADLWHILYAWRYRGGLYTISEHVALPLSYTQVVANLHRILRNLVLIQPAA
ncbi:MAG: hypothetical protein ACYDA3_02335 [Gaiellaceae bacterium]